MRSMSWLIVSLCIILSGCQQPQTADLAAEAQALREANAQWFAAMSAKDAAGAAGMFLRDGLLMPPNHPIVRDSVAIAEFYRGIFELPSLSLTTSWERDPIEVAEGGMLASQTGSYSLAFDGPSGRVEDRGKYLVVWKKVDGRWGVAAESFSSDLSPQ